MVKQFDASIRELSLFIVFAFDKPKDSIDFASFYFSIDPPPSLSSTRTSTIFALKRDLNRPDSSKPSRVNSFAVIHSYSRGNRLEIRRGIHDGHFHRYLPLPPPLSLNNTTDRSIKNNIKLPEEWHKGYVAVIFTIHDTA